MSSRRFSVSAGREGLWPRALCLAVGLTVAAAAGAGAPPADDGKAMRTESLAPYHHRVTLYDEDGQAIGSGDDPVRAYSLRTTCGKCHDYTRISSGWHFNYMDPRIPAGRPGQPWFLTDPATATQVPLSYRRTWPGSVSPAALGIKPWQFVQLFGRHLPGGGAGEQALKVPDPAARWQISGRFEVDCLACHSADASHDQAERTAQITRQNLKWISAASGGFTVIRGAASKVPDDFDPAAPPNPDAPEQALPTVIYEKSRFSADDRVFFNTARTPSADRCYFCHTYREVGATAAPRWQRDRDVHLASGMTCADCHRHGVDHLMVRGFEGELRARNTPAVATLSCRGCHYGAGPQAAMAGRFGAPRPRHTGLPEFHLDKLSCTACHSGLMPAAELHRIQSARAHGLGIARKDMLDDALPWIVEPVMIRQTTDGRIAPHRAVWPAFWGRLEGTRVKPLAYKSLDKLIPAAAGAAKTEEAPTAWGPLTGEQIAQAAQTLAEREPGAGEIVYVAGGRVHRRSADGKVAAQEHPAARPYTWPLAHDVRPAQQALGAAGCAECHAPGAAFVHGTVRAQPAMAGATPLTQPMHAVTGIDPRLMRAWGTLLVLRWPALIACLVASAVLTAMLVHYLFVGVAGIPRGPR